ncbi:MAG TPA: sulfite exporter TauE/SafE family protein [Patescibacteria group bacterium]|nr:sulfite exporter TauE/SafE family protein [Patescibacteria group bacterium]
MNNFWLAFITGLTSGGISCFAVQGGLLTSAIASNEEIEVSRSLKAKALIIFLGSKLAAYAVLGFILGSLGSSLNISPKIQGYLLIFVGIYMLLTAARLLNIHPIFRYFEIAPPKFILRMMRNQAQAKSFFTPMILGTMTVFIPCGVTQAMMLLAIASGSALLGAGIMFFFVLGTTPVFFAIGYAATELMKKKIFNIVAAVAIAIIGILSINSGQILRGSVHTLQNYWTVLIGKDSQGRIAIFEGGFQEATIEVKSNGYTSDTDTLKLGVPVKLVLNSHGVRSCAKSFVIPSLSLFKILPEDGSEVLEFTPNKKGLLTYACGMGMYTGSFNVVE